MQASCPSCGAGVPQSAIAWTSGQVRCPNCGHSFVLKEEVGGRPLFDEKPPRRLQNWIHETHSTLTIRRRRHPIPATLFVMLSIFALVGSIEMWTGKIHSDAYYGLVPWAALPLSAYMLYATLGLLISTTTLTVNESTIQRRGKPNLWARTLTVPTAEVTHVFFRPGTVTMFKTFCDVVAVRSSGKPVVFWQSITTRHEARLIQDAIERHLKLTPKSL